jgi:hypothetical protein
MEVSGQIEGHDALPPEYTVPGTRRVGGWVSLRGSLYVIERRKSDSSAERRIWSLVV